jgi:hypothetical protein
MAAAFIIAPQASNAQVLKLGQSAFFAGKQMIHGRAVRRVWFCILACWLLAIETIVAVNAGNLLAD